MEKIKKEERLEQLLNEKSFDVLTSEEKSFVLNELGSEEQYNAMRRINPALITKVDLSPDPHILTLLHQRMKPVRRSAILAALNFQMPAYTFLLMVFIIFGGVWIFRPPSEVKQAPAQIVEVLKRDTVYITAKADTIYRDRIIYRQAGLKDILKSKHVKIATVIAPVESEKEVGVTMKEKTELEILLVSGTR